MRESNRTAVRIGGGLVLAAAIVACGGPAVASQPASAAASATPQVATASAAATATEPAPTPSLTLAIPSPDAGSPLVDLLPAELGGTATQKLGVIGSDVSMFDAATATIFDGMLTLLDADGADMAIGIASNSRASIVAIRVKGKSAQEVGNAMIVGRALNATTTKDQVDLGGKHVTKVTTTTTKVPFYVYAKDDISFTVAGTDETIVAEALSKLP